MNWLDRIVFGKILQRIMDAMEGTMGLTGYRTYICAAIIVVAAGLNQFQVIDDATYKTIIGIFGGAGLAFLRAAK